jgi:hypothetical protein
MHNYNKSNNINVLAHHAAAHSLMTAIEAEIKLARYWLKQTVKNYRAWRQQDANPAPARDLLHTDQTVRQLVSRMLREYRRKQKLLGEMKLGQSHWGKADVEYFRHVNHYGPAMAAHFANDNVVH